MICIMFATLGFKVRRCRDDFCIRSEFKYLSFIGGVTILSMLITQPATAHHPALEATVRIATLTVVLVPFYYVSTKWVLDNYKQRLAEKRKLAKMPVELSLRDIFADEDYCDLFAHHVSNEFAIEGVLFLFEAARFQKQCIDQCAVPAQHISASVQYRYARTVHRPNSEITNTFSFFENLHFLYIRYISESAEYAVNISSAARNGLVRAFAPYTMLFDANSALSKPTSQNLGAYSMLLLSLPESSSTVALFVRLLSVAMDEVESLLNTDSRQRFLGTDVLKDMVYRKQFDALPPEVKEVEDWRSKISPRSPYDKWKDHPNKSSTGLRTDSLSESKLSFTDVFVPSTMCFPGQRIGKDSLLTCAHLTNITERDTQNPGHKREKVQQCVSRLHEPVSRPLGVQLGELLDFEAKSEPCSEPCSEQRIELERIYEEELKDEAEKR